MPLLATTGTGAAEAYGYQIAPTRDPYFNYNTALLSGNGTNSANNLTYVDSSIANAGSGWPITRTGAPVQGSFSPYSLPPGYWSTYFGGSGNYITTTTTSIPTTQTTFTVEGWVYMSVTPTGATPVVVGDMSPTAATVWWAFGIPNNLRLTFYWFDTAGKSAVGSTTLSVGVWYHIAVSVNNNAISMYVNGVAETLTGTTTLTNRGGTLTSTAIAQASTATLIFNGYISNLSILSGTAKYNINFTPSTTPLATNTTNQTFLFSGNNRLADLNTATSAQTLTPVGASLLVVPRSPFSAVYPYSAGLNGGSANFWVASAYLNPVGAQTDCAFGTGDFSVSCWIYPTSTAAVALFFDTMGGTTTGRFTLQYETNQSVSITVNAGVNFVTSTAGCAPVNSWSYITASRVSGTTRLFVNGTQRGSNASAITLICDANRPVIGTNGSSLGNNSFNGYVANLRVIKGSGVTTDSIPTSPLPITSDTKLLMNFTNGAVSDLSRGFVINTLSTSGISTTTQKWGVGSLFFPSGASNYFQQLNAPNFNLGTGAFTMDFWLYIPTSFPTSYIVDIDGLLNSAGRFVIRTETNGTFTIRGTSLTTVYLTSSVTYAMSLNTWTHITIMRTGGDLGLYVNGVRAVAANANTTNFTATVNGGLAMGGVYSSGGTGGVGGFYLQSFRVTPGIARYPASTTAGVQAFPVPTAPAPLQ